MRKKREENVKEREEKRGKERKGEEEEEEERKGKRGEETRKKGKERRCRREERRGEEKNLNCPSTQTTSVCCNPPSSPLTPLSFSASNYVNSCHVFIHSTVTVQLLHTRVGAKSMCMCILAYFWSGNSFGKVPVSVSQSQVHKRLIINIDDELVCQLSGLKAAVC